MTSAASGQKPLALEGIRVLDFTRVIAGPLCTMTLGDLGAEVVKVESPAGGDDTRFYGAAKLGGETAFFMTYNRNKKSLVLDLASEEGRAIALSLAEKADVLVENFSTGVMERHGLGYDAVKARNPRIVYCSISAYGRTGPSAARPGYDPVVQAESGFMSITGSPDREPLRTGIPMIDVTTGLAAGQAVLAALYAREETGQGQFVEVPLFDTAVAMTFHFGMAYLVSGENPERVGNSSPAAQPIGVFHASDGPFQLTIAGERVWKKLVSDVLQRPDLLSHPDFAVNQARVANQTALREILDDIFAGDTRDSWVARMRAAGVPAGPIRTIAEAVESPEVKERKLTGDAPHASAGSAPYIRNSMRLSGTPIREAFGAPLLGQHTDEILASWLDLGSDRISALRESGVTAPRGA